MPPNHRVCEGRPDRLEREIREGDYAYARIRARLRKRGHHLERGYEVASHFAEVIAARSRKEEQSLEELFCEHVGRWKEETQHCSSVTKMIALPSYLRIIGLAGKSHSRGIERLLLQELQSEPDHWFAALSAITGEEPVQSNHDFDEAVSAWLQWGRDKGII